MYLTLCLSARTNVIFWKFLETLTQLGFTTGRPNLKWRSLLNVPRYLLKMELEGSSQYSTDTAPERDCEFKKLAIRCRQARVVVDLGQTLSRGRSNWSKTSRKPPGRALPAVSHSSKLGTYVLELSRKEGRGAKKSNSSPVE
jgi:hypothetical protein